MVEEKVKFMEQAIRNARDEVFEELSSLEEGGDMKSGFSAIRAILSDLLDSSVNFENYTVEAEDLVAATVATPTIAQLLLAADSDAEGESSHYGFRVGETVRVSDLEWIYTPEDVLYKAFGIEELGSHPEGVINADDIRLGELGTIAGRRHDPYQMDLNDVCYIVESDGRYFFAMAEALE